MSDIQIRSRFGLVLLALVLSGGPASAQEQGPFDQNQAGAPAAATAPATSAGNNSADARRLGELFYQLQVLQQEVQELRGLVEEQAYQLSRLARDQQEQYIDLDGRIASMGSGSGSGAGSGSGISARPGIAGGAGAAGTAGSTPFATPGGSTPVGTGASERDVYTQAFERMKARQFDESIAGFNELIVAYPNGQYTPNAFYWLGELYLAKTDNEQARQSFAQVLNLYPDHPKVPDTLYKLGVVYHRLGDTNRALDYFRQVRADYPDSSAAGLATRYMAELQ